MRQTLDNWKVQIKKGYQEYCILLAIWRQDQLYGLELLTRLSEFDLDVKEGTLYPMLNRLTQERLLKASWQTETSKGHPRKIYSLTRQGHRALVDMEVEFNRMTNILGRLQKGLQQ